MKNVKLEEMTPKDYDDYMMWAIADYEKDLVKSRRFDTKEAAQEFAVWEFQDIFKNGFYTTNVYLYNIIVEGKKIGVIWFLNEDKQGFPGEGFIGDFLIYEAYRKKGYGYETLISIEALAKAQGLTEMRLGVMEHNLSAKRLYEKAGYVVFKEREHDFIMRKFL